MSILEPTDGPRGIFWLSNSWPPELLDQWQGWRRQDMCSQPSWRSIFLRNIFSTLFRELFVATSTRPATQPSLVHCKACRFKNNMRQQIKLNQRQTWNWPNHLHQ